MALATFHSNRGEKSSLILIKANALVFNATPVYVPRAATEGLKEGESFEIPDGFRIVDMVDENGESRKTESGEPLKVLTY